MEGQHSQLFATVGPPPNLDHLLLQEEIIGLGLKNNRIASGAFGIIYRVNQQDGKGTLQRNLVLLQIHVNLRIKKDKFRTVFNKNVWFRAH